MESVEFFLSGKKLVHAERVTEDNMARLSIWCGGEIVQWCNERLGDHLLIKLPNDQTASVGAWIAEVRGEGFHAFSNQVYSDIAGIQKDPETFNKILSIVTDLVKLYGPDELSQTDNDVIHSKALSVMDIIYESYIAY